MTDLKDNRLEKELIETHNNATLSERKRITNQTVNTHGADRCGNRYFLSSKGPNLEEITKQSLQIEAKKQSGLPDQTFDIVPRPKVLFKNYKDDTESPRLPAIQPMLRRRIDDSLVFPPRIEPHDPHLII